MGVTASFCSPFPESLPFQLSLRDSQAVPWVLYIMDMALLGQLCIWSRKPVSGTWVQRWPLSSALPWETAV